MKDDITRNKDKDVFGDALWSFQKKSSNKEIITWTNLTDEDPVKIKYFFRDYENMPKIEKKALKMCKGKVLDIGCGAGSHGLYIQNNMKMSVIGIDDSKRAVEVSKERGLKKVVLKSIWDYKAEGFDTILLLMNGMGIAKSIDNLSPFLLHLKKKLNHGGQILVDSSDLIYLFDEEDIALWEKDKLYYGEVDYGISFENNTESFPWLYIGFEKLEKIAKKNNLKCELIIKGDNYDYLAKIF